MQHVIKKQTINLFLSGTGRAAAFRLQQALSRHYWQEILPEIEEVFDACSTENEVICIDRLEIDLGRVTVATLTEDRLPAFLMDAIREQLREGIRTTAASGKVQPVAANIYGHWLFYMQHGYVPWNTIRITDEWYTRVLEALATDHASVVSLVNLLQTDPILLYRITQQHRDDFLINLAGILVPHTLIDLPVMINEMTVLFERLVTSGMKLQNLHAATSGEGDPAVRKLIWREILKRIARQDPGLSCQALARIILEQVIPAEDRKSILQYVSEKFTILPPVLTEWEQRDYAGEDSTEARPIPEEEDQEEDQSLKPEDTIFVQQAGAVLLHPFLNTFFTRLKLIESGAFADPSAKQKALYLIHYMATGSGKAEEHELVIPKVLCQYPFLVPVDAEVQITQAETREADHLLEETIRQWVVLKSTTVAGLRDGFLKRPGKLSRKNGHWRLQVESNAIDVLLDQLPWNLSVIKLPWMKELMMVEWR